MATGRSAFLWHALVGWVGYWMCFYGCEAHCGEGEVLSCMVYFGQHPLWHYCQRIQLPSHDATGSADEFMSCVGVHHPLSAAPAHNTPEDGAGLHRLVKNPQHQPADVEAPQLPHKIETALTRPAEEKEVFLVQSSLLCRHIPGTYFSRCPKGNMNSISIINFYFCFLSKRPSSIVIETDINVIFLY